MPDLKQKDLKLKTGALRPGMRAAAERLALPLKRGLRHTSGNVAGTGTGSSIDFQDHRPYVPGDDPRHIDWQAYARSGHYTMKLYREEVRPLADILLDASPSMFLSGAKTARVLELALFCQESALRSGASVRMFVISGSEIAVLNSVEDLEDFEASQSAAPQTSRIPWRAGSLRVMISDLLYPDLAEGVLQPLLSSHGRAVIFAPWEIQEAQPDWLGNTELHDCETPAMRDVVFRQADLDRYALAYRKHFDLWLSAARRLGIPLARTSGEGSFYEALSTEALPVGAVEIL